MANEGQDKYMELTESQRAGTVGWKQGNMYRYVYPPYRENDFIPTPIPLEGVSTSETAQEAYETVKDKIIYPVRHKMGIFDIVIKPGGEVEYIENEDSFNKQPKPEKPTVAEVQEISRPQVEVTSIGLPAETIASQPKATTSKSIIELPESEVPFDAYGLPVKSKPEPMFNVRVPPKPPTQKPLTPEEEVRRKREWMLHGVPASESLSKFGL